MTPNSPHEPLSSKTFISSQQNILRKMPLVHYPSPERTIQPPPYHTRCRLCFLSAGLQTLSCADDVPKGSACSICTEDLEVGDGKIVRVDTCGHLFHEQCVLPWFNGRRAACHTCPNCRTKLFLPDWVYLEVGHRGELTCLPRITLLGRCTTGPTRSVDCLL